MNDFRRVLIAVVAGAGIFAAAGAARAESYDTIELGVAHDRETCMSKAEYVLFSYKNRNGGGSVARANWVVYGWDLRPGDQDVVILCPVVNNVVDAFLVVHSESSEGDRDFTVQQIQSIWSQ